MGLAVEFDSLRTGVLIKRYQRFLADVDLDDGERVTVHCPNTGAMTGCAEPGSRVWLSFSDNPRRKLAWTWELVESSQGLICIHSARANAVVRHALESTGALCLGEFSRLEQEVRIPGGGRADFRLSSDSKQLWLEVKAVSWLNGSGLGLFPDSVSDRARRHVRSLCDLIAAGDEAALVFCGFHQGIDRIAPASTVDPLYANLLTEASKQGLGIYGLQVNISPAGLHATGLIDVELA